MRLPTGKAIEDIIGWALHPRRHRSRRRRRHGLKGVWQVLQDDKGFGVPVRDPNGSWYKALWESAAHVIGSQMPADAIKQRTTRRRTRRRHRQEEARGNVTGFTFSQGHPGGPEAQVAAKTNERFEKSKKYTMQLVKDDLKRGDEDAAWRRWRRSA
jgi:hypothetical protein